MAEGTIAGNAEVARQLGYLRPTDITAFNPDELLYKAKECVMHGMPLDRPVWSATLGPLVGMIDQVMAGLKTRGDFSDYDETIGSKIRQIVARSTGYEDALERERTEFLDLCTRSFTHARIRHMLETGKPLRN
jgi:3-hydroxyacyl-CoA dehydrogenase